MNILVVESSATMLALERFWLERRGGHTLTIARTGKEALEIIANSKGIDRVITSQQIDSPNGLEVLRKAKEQMAGVTTMLTGSSLSEVVREAAQKLGVDVVFTHNEMETIFRKGLIPNPELQTV